MSGVNIFLSYRRDDSGHAGRLTDHLGRRFPGYIFRDITGIAPGVDFVRELESKLDACDVLLVVIGRTWLTMTNPDGTRRLDDPGDFVRLEVAAGLRRDVYVVPVLVNGAAMPQAADLPADLKSLATRQALEVSERDFADDVTRLCQAIERRFNLQPPRPAEPRPQPPPPPPPPSRGWLKLVLALGGGALLMVVAFIVLVAIIAPAPPGPARPGSDSNVGGNALNPAPVAGGVKQQTQSAQAGVPPPAPAAGEPGSAEGEEDFFTPDGSWRVSSADVPGVYVVYNFKPGGRATVRFNVANMLQGDGQGQWGYDAGARELVVSGTMSHDGTPFREVIYLTGRDGDAYAVHHPDLGPAVMTRR